MLAELENEGIPASEECRMLMANFLKMSNAMLHHCRAVAEIAKTFAVALNLAGEKLNAVLQAHGRYEQGLLTGSTQLPPG
jgi:HD superfamily phosphodiesterase